jgi:hypothetical protein
MAREITRWWEDSQTYHHDGYIVLEIQPRWEWAVYAANDDDAPPLYTSPHMQNALDYVRQLPPLTDERGDTR